MNEMIYVVQCLIVVSYKNRCVNLQSQQGEERTKMAQTRKQIQELQKYTQMANESLYECLQRMGAQCKRDEAGQGKEGGSNNEESKIQKMRKQMESVSIFDKIEDFHMDESLESKILNLNPIQFTTRRKDDLFKRHKKDQEEKLVHRRKEIQKNYANRELTCKLTKAEFTLRNDVNARTETFPVTTEDMEKLRPETDLNDTIVHNYIKLLQLMFLPMEVDQKTHIFSSFFLEKLIGDYVKDEFVYDKEQAFLVQQVQEKVRQNYKNVKRWTKKLDIFEKDILVFPINAFKHWFCLLVLNPKYLLTPTPHKCQLIYCDSMLERKEFVVEAIRRYLEIELEDKKTIRLEMSDTSLPCHQLLLPRQTNTHDCGLYMMCYIEELLLRKQELEDLDLIPRRRKLTLFPRTLIYTMRERLKKLFIRLINSRDDAEKNQILAEYKGEKERILKEADDSDYDFINEKECKKYEKMNLSLVGGTNAEQKSFCCEIKFYLDPEINYYEKDKI